MIPCCMTLLAIDLIEWSLFGANAEATLQRRRLPVLLNGPDGPQELPLSLGDLQPYLIYGSLGPPIFKQNGISIGLAVFAHLAVECPITLQWAATFPQKIALFPGGSGPPSNTWYPGPTQVIIPNGISNGSVVFAWVPNAVLYNALSIEKKPPKLPLPLVISLPCLGRTEPRPTCVRCHSRLRFCWFWHALAHSSALVTVSS